MTSSEDAEPRPGESPEHIAAEIRATRRALAQTVDALASVRGTIYFVPSASAK